MPEQDTWSAFFDAPAAIDALDCATDHDLVEFGCGYGLFTVPAAQRVGGHVYALDIDPQMLRETADLAEQAGCRNVIPQQRDFIAHGCGRPDASAGYAMLFNLLHIEDPTTLLAETYRILRPGGKIGIMHWRRDIPTPRGPSLSIRPTDQQCRTWAEESGFQFIKQPILPGCPWHWGMVLMKTLYE